MTLTEANRLMLDYFAETEKYVLEIALKEIDEIVDQADYSKEIRELIGLRDFYHRKFLQVQNMIENREYAKVH